MCANSTHVGSAALLQREHEVTLQQAWSSLAERLIVLQLSRRSLSERTVAVAQIFVQKFDAVLVVIVVSAGDAIILCKVL